MEYPIFFWPMSKRSTPKNPIFLGDCPACKHRTFTDDPDGIYWNSDPPLITVKCTKCGLAGLVETESWELIQGFFRR